MPLIVVDNGAIRQCYALTTGWPTQRKIGLFSSPLVIDRHMTVGSLTPCVFSGYAGEVNLGAWSYPEMVVDRAIAECELVFWTHDGGPVNDYVAGYYVIDYDGSLLWAETNPKGPVAMVASGQQFPVVPRLSAGTRYGSET